MTHLGSSLEREGPWPNIDTQQAAPWITSGHTCHPVQDPVTTETVCPVCGLVTAPPAFVSAPSLTRSWGSGGDRYAPTVVTAWGQIGGRRGGSLGILAKNADPNLRRALRLDAIGYMGRTPADRLMKRWYGFLRTAAGFDLNESMLNDALIGLQKIRAARGAFQNLSNATVDYALIHMVLREHHRPLPRGKMLERIHEQKISTVAFVRAIKGVKKLTGLGASVPRSSDFLWAVADRLTPTMLRRAREASREALRFPALENLMGETLAAGIIHALSLAESANNQLSSGTSVQALCESFGVADTTVLQSSRLVQKSGLVGVPC